MSKEMKRRGITKERMTKRTRGTGREKGMAIKDDFSKRMEISKRTGAILGRRKRKKINLVKEGIKGKDM